MSDLTESVMEIAGIMRSQGFSRIMNVNGRCLVGSQMANSLLRQPPDLTTRFTPVSVILFIVRSLEDDDFNGERDLSKGRTTTLDMPENGDHHTPVNPTDLPRIYVPVIMLV